MSNLKNYGLALLYLGLLSSCSSEHASGDDYETNLATKSDENVGNLQSEEKEDSETDTNDTETDNDDSNQGSDGTETDNDDSNQGSDDTETDNDDSNEDNSTPRTEGPFWVSDTDLVLFEHPNPKIAVAATIVNKSSKTLKNVSFEISDDAFSIYDIFGKTAESRCREIESQGKCTVSIQYDGESDANAELEVRADDVAPLNLSLDVSFPLDRGPYCKDGCWQ